MDQITLYFVFNGDTKVAGPYMAQAPATSAAVDLTKRRYWDKDRPSETLEVVEQTYGLISSTLKRIVTDGKIEKCSS